MLTVLTIAALLSTSPAGAERLALLYGGHSEARPAPRLTPKQKAWFKHAVEDILQHRAATVRRGVDASFPR